MQWNNVIAAALIFLVITLVLVVILLFAKSWLVKSGEVAISINDGAKMLHTESGKTLLATLGENGVHLSSACGGKGSCGQCKLQVISGGGDMLPTEAVHFTRKQIKDHWRLGCQVKVKNDMEIKVSESALDVKEWECTVISNKNVATFILSLKHI
ncbi:MAG: 2Fe-2S iron-sulfur cluster binding domain-containing protein, partial [Muribaculaceae bacterium]|nr:2Fe-2S iron-sulfur cluster binding domain-containing protein [Muribaculaceae bacterium]